MQKIIIAGTAYVDQPCPQCGSKRRISKTWKETLPTFTGTTTVKYSQIVCTNDVCQLAFDKQLLKDTRKRMAIKLKKEANDAVRKANSLRKAKKTRKNKSNLLI